MHNRSSFGALVFDNLTPANRAAIQRRLLPAAAGVYRQALNSRNGYLEIWQDPELGDQTFFHEVIEPLPSARPTKALHRQRKIDRTQMDMVFIMRVMQHAIECDLLDLGNGADLARPQSVGVQITLALQAVEMVHLERLAAITDEQLDTALATHSRQSPVLVRADKVTRLERFVAVVDRIRGLGFQQVSLEVMKW